MIRFSRRFRRMYGGFNGDSASDRIPCGNRSTPTAIETCLWTWAEIDPGGDRLADVGSHRSNHD